MEAKHEKISFTLVEQKLFKRVSAFRLEVSVTNDLPEKLNFRVKMKNGIEIDESQGEMQHSYDILQILYTVCFTNLDRGNEMTIFESILTPFEASFKVLRKLGQY